jgi:hypothetical protein
MAYFQVLRYGLFGGDTSDKNTGISGKAAGQPCNKSAQCGFCACFAPGRQRGTRCCRRSPDHGLDPPVSAVSFRDEKGAPAFCRPFTGLAGRERRLSRGKRSGGSLGVFRNQRGDFPLAAGADGPISFGKSAPSTSDRVRKGPGNRNPASSRRIGTHRAAPYKRIRGKS